MNGGNLTNFQRVHTISGITAFLAGAVIMSIELLGPRMLSPHFGLSIEVWSNVIGATLLALALGYLLGGRACRTVQASQWLRTCFLVSALYLALVSLVEDPVAALIAEHSNSSSIGALLAFVILFGLPVVLLSAISPALFKVNVQDAAGAAGAAAYLGAASTAGSLVGTFTTGYVLLYFLSTSQLLAWQAGCCLLSAAIQPGVTRRGLLLMLALAAFVVLPAQSARPNEVETLYSRYQIVDMLDARSGRQIRVLKNGPCGIQSAIYLDTASSNTFASLEERLQAGEGRYPIRVLSFFDAYRFFTGKRDALRVLVLGAGAFVYPQKLLEQPNVLVDVVDIDPGLPKLAADFFGLRPDSRLTIHSIDARAFINQATSRFDVIIVDVFTSACSLPAHVITRQSVQKLRRLLEPNGAVITNAIGTITGEPGRAVPALAATFHTAFPHVSVAAVESVIDLKHTQNFAIVASNRPPLQMFEHDPEFQRFGQHTIPQQLWNNGAILDDRFAPLELYR